MQTALKVALDIDRLIKDAIRVREPLDIPERATEVYLRFADVGYTRCEIAEVIEIEAEAAGLPTR